jgi:hypothetical protein
MPDAPDLRASDEQRERAARAIREHFAAGRLTEDELSDRVQAVYGARTQGELSALLADLPNLPPTPAERKAELAERRGALQRRLLQEAGGGSGAFLICTAIWLASGASGFFWPIFVALGTLVPLVRNAWRLYGPQPELDRVERELEARGRRGHGRGEQRAELERTALDRHYERRAARDARRNERRRGRF